jgi:putative aldouronate transport system substrate-binding protein
MIPFGHSGGKGSYYLGSGSFGTTALKKAPKKRIEELLRVANYLAAPFGTQENFFLTNGVEGVDFTRNSQGAPIATTKGPTQNALSQGYITSSPSVNVNTQYPDFIKAIHQQEQQLVPLGIPNPTIGLYSETAEDRGSDLATLVDDQLSSIIAGRAPISSLSTLIQNWRSQGGEQMRNEFQKSYEANHK